MAALLRSRRAAAGVVAGLCLLAAGCGSSGTVEGGNDTYQATTLTVYTDLPFLGPDGAVMTEIANGETIALYDAGGHVGKLHVSIEKLNDAADVTVAAPDTPSPLPNDTDQVAESAYIASSDLSTTAYIGDFDSAATAPALQLLNQNDILQISPASNYAGFTDRNPTNLTGDPGGFYPSRVRTFSRLVPSAAVEARATVSFMRSLGVSHLALLADTSTYDSLGARLVAADAAAAGITLVGQKAGIDTQSASAPRDFTSVVAAVVAEHPDAVLLAGSPDPGADALFRALHAALPQAKLFAPSTLAMPSFLAALGPAAASATYVTSPILELDQYPPKAQAVFAQYRRLFAPATPTAYALYGYDAMEDVLAAIARAGNQAAKRTALVSAFFHLGEIHGAIGDYTISPSGDTSLKAFDGYRVGAGGALVLVRRLG